MKNEHVDNVMKKVEEICEMSGRIGVILHNLERDNPIFSQEDLDKHLMLFTGLMQLLKKDLEALP
jgi:hypothetical protein